MHKSARQNQRRVVLSHLQTDFSNCRGWDTLIFCLETNFLQRYDFASHTILALVHHTVCALADLLNLLVSLHSDSFVEVQQTSLLLVDANTAAVGGVLLCSVERSSRNNGAQLAGTTVLFGSVKNVYQRNLNMMGVGKSAAGVLIKRCQT